MAKDCYAFLEAYNDWCFSLEDDITHDDDYWDKAAAAGFPKAEVEAMWSQFTVDWERPTLTKTIKDALKQYERPCSTCAHKKNGNCARWSCEPEDKYIDEIKAMYYSGLVR
jgi:hypothetical protein